MKAIRALLGGLIFLVVMTSTAVASCHEGCISNGPIDEGESRVFFEAQRLGVATKPEFVTAMQSLKAVTSKYQFDLGLVYDCQTGTPSALQILGDRLMAFKAINTAIGIVQASGSEMPQLVPMNGLSHVETITAMEGTWPDLKSYPSFLLDSFVRQEISRLEAFEAARGTLEYEFGTPDHWAITHPAAMKVREIDEHVHEHFREIGQTVGGAIMLFSLIAAAVLFIRRRQQRRIGQVLTA